jgi:signal transduction histidine kinase
MHTSLPRLLVVDDEPANFDVIETQLHGENYDLHYAASGLKVMERLEKFSYDLILLDVMMPIVDGIELCKQIKAHPQHRWTLIIMVTALSGKDDLARCLAAGADDFISKPVSGVEIRARVRSMLRIRSQQEQIKAMVGLRAEMTNTIVHDLRNPLTAILLASSSLMEMELPANVRKKCDRIHGATTRLSGLVDDILVLSKLESGKLTLSLHEVDLANLIGRVVDDMSILAQAKSIQLSWQCEPQLTVKADFNLLRRSLENLVGNAIKYSPSGSQITVTGAMAEGWALVRVADQGVGIPPHRQQAIWERYHSGDVAQTVTAIGLGLSFCKLILEAHGGSVHHENNVPQGSIFTASLPLADAVDKGS